jgi:hypothetical protein
LTEHEPRTGPARDVPPPRPVVTPGPRPRGNPWAYAAGDVEESGGLARAARAVADAVSSLLGTGSPDGPSDARERTAAQVMRDVFAAVAGATGAARGGKGPRSGSQPGSGAEARAGERGPGAVLSDLLAAAAPRLPIRDADRLRAAYPGLTDEEIADALVARAARLTATVGAGAGGLSAAQWFAPPSLVALPLSLGAETVVTAAIEVVLIGELHELHGRPAVGDARQRASAYLSSWSTQRAVDGSSSGLVALLGSAGLQELRRRVSRRLARSVGSAAPFLVGASISGLGNRRATETLAERVRADLRRGRQPGEGRD